jgi:ribosomal protein L24E
MLVMAAVASTSLVPTGAAQAAHTVPYLEPPAPTPPIHPAPRPTGRLVPAQGSLFGIHTVPDSPTAKTAADMGITKREADAGRTLDIDNHYYAAFDAAAPLSGGKPTLPGWREQWDIQNGRIPLVSWGGADVIQIVNGKYDAAIDAAATRFQALGAPFFLRWFWEPDGTRSTKAALSHTPPDYVKAWRYIHDRFVKAGNTNAVWVWCPVSLDFYPPSGQTSTDPELAPNHAINQWGAQPYYPGDDVVDWMCADGYNWAPNKPGTRYESFQELFQAFYNWSVPHNKPLMVGETGVQELQPGDKAKWLTAMHTSLTQHYPNIVAFLYFDTQNANGLANEWWLESSPDAYAAWKDMAHDPYFNQPHTGLDGQPLGTPAPVVSGQPPPTSINNPASPPHPSGYRMLGADGKVYPFGDARGFGDPSPLSRTTPAADVESTPSGNGYWLVTAAGAVYAYGDATYRGGLPPGGVSAGEEVTSLSATRSGKGYWLFTTRGRVFPFGDAAFHGDMAKVALNGPVLDSVPTASGNGYYMVASDGGIFAFCDARFNGSMGNRRLNAPVQSLVPDPDGVGYWLVASDGGVFAFDAPFRGSMGNVRLARPVTGMVSFGNGYLMVAQDGGVFDFSDRPFAGSLGNHPPDRPIVAVSALG